MKIRNPKLSNIFIFVIIIVIAIATVAYIITTGDQTLPKPPTVTNTPPRNTNQATAIEYTNAQYGFNFALPLSWKNYSIVETTWTGVKASDKGEKTIATGPIISIRHPLWTAKVPRQDIPIMVFTTKQWIDLQNDAFHIGAAPIGPSELGHNSKFVFSLPARYNFAFPVGYEEVDAILQNKPLSAF